MNTARLAFAFLLIAVNGLAIEPNGRIYPNERTSPCGSLGDCRAVLDEWNDAAWSDLVDESFNTANAMAAVRWYDGEWTYVLKSDGHTVNQSNSQFVGVTDELSMVMLSAAMGSRADRFKLLRNFAELLRVPALNNLQCWKYYINGDAAYTSSSQVCILNDSASDASLRILGAYGIACAKQRSGEWPTSAGDPDYCADYHLQGNSIWGRGTALHGEIKLLANGQYYLANGFNNQGASPTNGDAFRPDYYELQFLIDFAEEQADPALKQGVADMLGDYVVAMGTNHVHRGKTGHFDAATTTYSCDQLCTPPYMDLDDTWRAVPALSSYLAVHPENIPASDKSAVFDHWWPNYGGGAFAYGGGKPIEIYSNSADGSIKLPLEESYRTHGMWIPLAITYDATWARNAITHLVDMKYDPPNRQFYGAGYFGGYASQFAVRSLALSAGMLDPATWMRQRGDVNGDGRLDLVWRHATTGANYLWFLHDTSRAAARSLLSADTSWTIAGVADCFGDSTRCLAFRRTTTGENYLWRVRGSDIVSATPLPLVPTDWVIEAFRDFDGDGKADLFWRNTVTGTTYLWRMNGASVIAAQLVNGAQDTAWRVVASGDFDHDGNADLLWRHDGSGQTYVWMMDGATIAGAGALSTASSDWKAESSGDYDGDAKTDILWRRNSGEIVLWLLDGISIKSSQSLPTTDPLWKVVASGDTNGDATDDLIWRHTSTGGMYVWIVRNATAALQHSLPGESDTAWQVVAPR